MKNDKPKKEVTKSLAQPQQNSQSKLAQTNASVQTRTEASNQNNSVSAQPPTLTPEQQKLQDEMNATIKEIENAMYALKFYPVAVNEDSKNKAVEKLEEVYNKGNETVRQLLLYMIHENLATSIELKMMRTFEFFKMKSPNLDPAQLRINVYRAMFNYHTSMEGIIEMVKLLGRLKGGDDAVKLLTHHFSHLCTYESEANHILRAAILDALGHAESLYALRALMDYANYSDNDRTYGRVVNALLEWDKKLDKTKLGEPEKNTIRTKMKEYMSRESSESHYG